MIIRKVSLRNIKSYKEAEIELQDGITGIAGSNGSGKSTIIESIGYALFDCLPYTQSEFVRKGEKSGEVTIEFAGADGMEYTVTRKCGSSQAYFLIDTFGNKFEGKDDVGDRLCQILGYRVLELEQLRSLFENAVGVLQGTFVSEFLESAGKRKAIFDPLLRIDEYSIASKNLIALKNTVKDRIDQLENEKKFLEGRASQLEPLKKEKEGLDAESAGLVRLAGDKKRDLEEAKVKKEALDVLEKAVLELESRARVATAEATSGRREVTNARSRLEIAEAAEKRLKDNEAGNKAYTASYEEKGVLEKKRLERDVILTSINSINTKMAGLKAKVAAVDRTLQEIAQAEKEIPALKQKTEEQEQLEAEKEKMAALVKAGEIELAQVRERMSRAKGSKGNICPILNVECSSITDFSGYFEEQVKRIESERGKIGTQALEIAEKISDLGNPRVGLAVKAEMVKKREKAQAERQTSEAESETLTRELMKQMSRLNGFETLEKQISQVNADIERFRPSYEEYQQNMKVAGQKADLQKSLEIAVETMGKLEQRLNEINSQLEEKRKSYNKDTHAREKAAYESLSSEIAAISARTDAVLRRLAVVIEEIRKIAGDILRIEEIKQKQATENQYLGFVEQSRSIIKLAGPEIVKVYIDLISREATNMYGEIAGDRRLEIRWTSDYDIIMVEDGRERSFKQLSGGEQMSAALAVRLAILKILTSSDVVFLDEPTQNMDESRRQNLAREIIRIRGFKQMIVISHDDTFNANLENVLEIEKISGESSVRGQSFARP